MVPCRRHDRIQCLNSQVLGIEQVLPGIPKYLVYLMVYLPAILKYLGMARGVPQVYLLGYQVLVYLVNTWYPKRQQVFRKNTYKLRFFRVESAKYAQNDAKFTRGRHHKIRR